MRGKIIGRPMPRVEGAEKVSGALCYTADHYRPGTLWGKVLRSPYSHARILNYRYQPGEKSVRRKGDRNRGGSRSKTYRRGAQRYAGIRAGSGSLRR